MTDKERILSYIIQRIFPAFILGTKDSVELFSKCSDSNIMIGDLVLAITSGLHEFTVGYVTEINEKWDMVIREIGSERTCKINNEQFYKIDTDVCGLNPNELLEGKQYEIYQKVKKALKDTEYKTIKTLLLHHVEFVGKNKCKVFLREKWHEYDYINPISFEFNYDNRISVKRIKSELFSQLAIIQN